MTRDEIWDEAFDTLERAEHEIQRLVPRAARIGAYDSAARLCNLACGLRAIKDEVESCSVPEWLAERAEP